MLHIAFTTRVDTDLWVAAHLDYDICSYASDETIALKRLQYLVKANINILGGLEDIPRSECSFLKKEWTLWALKI